MEHLEMPQPPKVADDKDPKQERYLTEGVCPFRHGPLLRVDKYLAACTEPRCNLQWRSKRVAVVFGPEKVGK